MRNRETHSDYSSILDYVVREYDEVRRDLHRCLRRRQMNETESEDHISDAMIRVLKHHEKYEGKLEPLAMNCWLRRVTLNMAFKKYRVYARRTEILTEQGFSPRTATRVDDTEQRAESRMLLTTVLREINEMHPSYTRALRQMTGDAPWSRHNKTYVKRIRMHLSERGIV